MSIEENFDFKKFIQRIHINPDTEEAFMMWATSENLEKWYVKSAIYHTPEGNLKARNEPIAMGDEYEWIWTDGAKLNGIILKADGKNIEFTFGNDVVVSVRIKQLNGRTLIELEQQHNFADAEMKFNNYMACFPGWEFYLINLKSICDGGIDLRETKPDIDLLVNI